MRLSPIQQVTKERNQATLALIRAKQQVLKEAMKKPGKKLTRKQVAALKRHLKRTRVKMSVGSCRVMGGKMKGEVFHGSVVVCRRGVNRWELL